MTLEELLPATFKYISTHENPFTQTGVSQFEPSLSILNHQEETAYKTIEQVHTLAAAESWTNFLAAEGNLSTQKIQNFEPYPKTYFVVHSTHTAYPAQKFMNNLLDVAPFGKPHIYIPSAKSPK